MTGWQIRTIHPWGETSIDDCIDEGHANRMVAMLADRLQAGSTIQTLLDGVLIRTATT